MTHVSVDRGLCIGCDLCAELCPETFEMVDHKAEVRDSHGHHKEHAEEAAEKCPTHAIRVSETDWLERIEVKS